MTAVMSEMELLARQTVRMKRLCQHLDRRSVDDGADENRWKRVIRACAKDLKTYKGADFVGVRPELCGRLAEVATTLMDVPQVQATVHGDFF